jgi:hypothetical protein
MPIILLNTSSTYTRTGDVIIALALYASPLHRTTQHNAYRGSIVTASLQHRYSIVTAS